MLNLDKLLKIVRSMYPKDSIKPGIVVSNLRPGEYYASVVRYIKGEKSVPYSVKAKVKNVNEILELLVEEIRLGVVWKNFNLAERLAKLLYTHV